MFGYSNIDCIFECEGGFMPTVLINAVWCIQVFKLTDMKTLRKKSRFLTGYYELLLKNLSPDSDQESNTEKKKPTGTSFTVHSYLCIKAVIITLSM